MSFGKLTGDKQTVKTTDRFMAYGRGSENETNPDYLWDTFNGTDEDNDLAVLKVSLDDLSADTRAAISVAVLGDSDALRVGEQTVKPVKN